MKFQKLYFIIPVLVSFVVIGFFYYRSNQNNSNGNQTGPGGSTGDPSRRAERESDSDSVYESAHEEPGSTFKSTRQRSTEEEAEYVKKKSKFFDNAFKNETDNFHEQKNDECEKILINPPTPATESKTTQLNVEFKEDSIYELLKLIEKGEKDVTGNSVADIFKIGGHFAVHSEESRNGKGGQEEAMMACFGRFFDSIYKKFGDKSTGSGKENENIFMYEKNSNDSKPILTNHILYSTGLVPRIPIDYINKYEDKREKFSFFDYLIEENYIQTQGIIKLSEVKHNINMYVTGVFDLNSVEKTKRDENFYDSVEEFTKNQISVMLSDAKTKQLTNIVLTVPIFEDILDSNVDGDKEYLKRVHKGMALAIKEFGLGFKIIVCGVSASKKVEFEKNMKN